MRSLVLTAALLILGPSSSAAAAPEPPATPLPAGSAGAIDQMLDGLGGVEAPDAKPDGSTFAAAFQEGQVQSQPVTLAPGKCYTVLAASIGGIEELDLFIRAAPAGMPPMTLAQDATTGPNATVGGKAAGCWKNPMPMTLSATIIVRATRGTGIAAARVYVR